MKKFFTLICAMICAVAANAATVDDIAVCKHSYVVNFAEVTQNGAVKPEKGNLYADGYVLAVTGNSVATNKGESWPAAITQVKDEDNNLIEEYFTHGEAFATKYADLKKIKNTLRLKNAQDVIAMKVTEGSKLIFLGQVHASRYPKLAANAALTEDVQTLSLNETSTRGYSEWVAPKNMTVYIGSEGGDWYLGYLIVEANEAPGTPTVKVGPQTYEGGLWYREVTCKANKVTMMGKEMNSVVTYTTDGTEPTASSTLYTGPIKVYQNSTLKFQAYYDMKGTGAQPTESQKLANADNEAPVSFSFNAPTLKCENGVVTVTSEYEGAKNMISLNGGEFEEANTKTLKESATVTAKSVIVNGTYATFETMPTSIDALVLTPITEEVTVTVSGEAVVDEEATATSTTGTIYMVENGVINADKMQFFNKGMQFKALANADAKNAKYQVPEGQEAYMMFGNDSRLYFEIGADAADVEVVCSKNSCKTLNEEEDENVATDRKCFVNVSGTTYGFDNCTYQEDGKTVDTWTPAGEIQTTINFELAQGSYYFAKYSGTGNILISSIKISPKSVDAIKNVNAASAAKVIKTIENGQLVIKSAKGTFNVAGAQMK